MHCYYASINMTKILNTETTKSKQEWCEQKEFSFIAGETTKWHSQFGRQFRSKTKYPLTIKSVIILFSICLPQIKNLWPNKILHAEIYSNFTHNCQNLEAIKMSQCPKWIYKPLVHLENGMLITTKKKWVIKSWRYMKGTNTY